MSPGRRHTPPLAPGPRGRVVTYVCAGCGDRVAGYEGTAPGTSTAQWKIEGSVAWCPHCAAERRETPGMVRCATCGKRTNAPDEEWVLFRGAWYCGPCADRPRRRHP